MQDSLAEAFLDGEHRVLRRSLFPLSLRRAFLLTVGENSYICGGIPTLGDLYQLTEICSAENPDDCLRKPPGFFSRWWWEWRTRKADFGAESAAVQSYLEDYTSGPQTWSKNGGGKKAQCHWIVSTLAGLMGRLGMTKEEAWKTTIGEGAWLLAASYDADPQTEISLVSEEEERIIAKIKEEEAAA